jgi:hypothetical protein
MVAVDKGEPVPVTRGTKADVNHNGLLTWPLYKECIFWHADFFPGARMMAALFSGASRQ